MFTNKCGPVPRVSGEAHVALTQGQNKAPPPSDPGLVILAFSEGFVGPLGSLH